VEEIEVRQAKNYGGLELKIALLQTGLKQYELTAKVAITPTQLSEIETGRRKLPSELPE
jgi:transcriptional regulator with XRE-family HTH domain